MKIARLIIYEGDEQALARQISKSMPEGTREGMNRDRMGQSESGCNITVCNLNNLSGNLIDALLENAKESVVQAYALCGNDERRLNDYQAEAQHAPEKR